MKRGPKGPRKDSIATQIRAMMLRGMSNEEIAKKLRKRSLRIRRLIMWHRWRYRKQLSLVAEILETTP